MQSTQSTSAEAHAEALEVALQQLRVRKIPGSAITELRHRRSEIDSELQQIVVSEIPAFSTSRNPEVLANLGMHAADHTREIIRLLADGTIGDFAFVSEHGRQRAEHRFPVEATLHAYRCGHKVISRWVREITLEHLGSTTDAQQFTAAIADFTLEYTDTISRVFTTAYLTHIQLLADVAGDKRSQLLTLLLDGYDESDGRFAGLLRDEGYLTGRLAFCVVLAQTLDPAELLNHHRARRLIQAINEKYQHTSIRRLIDMHNNRVTIVFSDVYRKSGWTSANRNLCERVSADLQMLGPSILVGISNDVHATALISGAYKEAQHALKSATVKNRLVMYSNLSARRIIQQLAAEDFSRMLPSWAESFKQADRTSNGILSATLRAYADADMNALEAAKALSIHANTIYARFQKISELTGVEPRSFSGLSDLLLVHECLTPVHL